MNFLGKQLVFLNVIFSFALLIWAVSLYLHRIEWTEATFGKEKLTESVISLQKEIQTARDIYNQIRAPIAPAEATFARYSIDTENILAEAQNGTFKEYVTGKGINLTSKKLVNGLTRDKEGKERPLQGIATLQKELEEEVEIAKTQLDLITENRATRAKLALEIFGKDPMGKDPTGFNPKAKRLKEIYLELGSEKIYLSDNRVNWDEQLSVLKRRNDQLVSRLKDLDSSNR